MIVPDTGLMRRHDGNRVRCAKRIWVKPALIRTEEIHDVTAKTRDHSCDTQPSNNRIYGPS
jgi:hypothetical protein